MKPKVLKLMMIQHIHTVAQDHSYSCPPASLAILQKNAVRYAFASLPASAPHSAKHNPLLDTRRSFRIIQELCQAFAVTAAAGDGGARLLRARGKLLDKGVQQARRW